MVTTTVHFPKLHAAQREIKDHPARFKVVDTGRRFGKTRLGLLMCLETALAGGGTWWVGLTYKNLRPAWRDLSRIARQIGGARIQEGDFLVTFPNGGEVMARTAEDPVNLRGEGLDGGVIDEAAHLKQGVWDGSIRPSLMDRAGWGDPDLEPRRHELVPRPLATRPAGSRPPKTFAFLEREPDPRLDEEPSLKEIPSGYCPQQRCDRGRNRVSQASALQGKAADATLLLPRAAESQRPPSFPNCAADGEVPC